MKFGKVGFWVILLGISLLSACGQKTDIFSGESENWRVQIEYEQRDEVRKKTGYIKYIGTEPIPKETEYSITDVSSSSGKGALGSDGVWSLGISECSPCTSPSEDSEFEGLIKWNNQSDTVTLTGE